ncbi:hypothetical protein FS842_005838, partial [Serendipita sp. 407]
VDLVNNTQIPGVKAPICITGAGKRFSPDKYFAAEKAREILGMTYRPQEDTLLDTIRSSVELGWKQEDDSHVQASLCSMCYILDLENI